MKAGKKHTRTLGRLTKRADFLRVRSAGEKWTSKSMVLQVADNPEGGRRYGLTVSKKTNASAVVRNRIRRRLRAAALEILPLKARDNTDYVLIGRVETENRRFDDLCKDLEWCLTKLGHGA